MEIITQSKKEKESGRLIEGLFEHPIIASIIIMFASIALTFIPLAPVLEPICGEQAAEYMAAIIEQVLVSCMLIAGLKKIGLFEKVGFTGKVEAVWIMWPMVIFCLLWLVDDFESHQSIDWSRPVVVITFALSYLSTGLFEETLCRGMAFNLMRSKWGDARRGCYLAMMLSSLLFGAAHFIHFILGHSDLMATLAQVGYATIFGVFFCACYVRNKSIYPAIILHGLVDIIGDLDEVFVGGGIDKSYKVMSASQAVTLVVIMIPFLIYGLWCVRKEFAKPVILENNKDK